MVFSANLSFHKSHNEWPDWEDYCEAKTRREAAEIFAERAARRNAGWEAEDLVKYIHEVDD